MFRWILVVLLQQDISPLDPSLANILSQSSSRLWGGPAGQVGRMEGAVVEDRINVCSS